MTARILATALRDIRGQADHATAIDAAGALLDGREHREVPGA